ncbi:hypothetical protein GCM10009727_52970 [Actinomadura napierensis]|uniref:Uncharacterized protein n=1 Tax=Actinomadura napierensis TaxID=267854 RepID=A0ABP5LQ69_9ACTN
MDAPFGVEAGAGVVAVGDEGAEGDAATELPEPLLPPQAVRPRASAAVAPDITIFRMGRRSLSRCAAFVVALCQVRCGRGPAGLARLDVINPTPHAPNLRAGAGIWMS